MTTSILPISRIPISHIDLCDFRYALVPFAQEIPTDEKTQQVKETGLLRPPIVKELSGGAYCVVSGMSSIATAQAISLSSIDCIILPAETSELKIFAIIISEAFWQGNLSPLEKAIFFQKVTQFCTIKEAAELFLPLLKQPNRASLITNFLGLANLEQPLAEALHNGLLDEKVAYKLAELSFRDRMILFEAISTLRLSVSNQRKLINYCTDLSLRENSSILTVISTKEVQEIIIHKDANPPQKAAKLMIYLQNALSPRHAKAQKSFNSLKNSLNLPKWATLTHVAAFEKDDLTLSITFRNSETLIEFCKASQLEHAKNGTWKKNEWQDNCS